MPFRSIYCIATSGETKRYYFITVLYLKNVHGFEIKNKYRLVKLNKN